MKIMAVDYGDQRTGIAVSDLTGSIVGETWVIREWDAEHLADTITDAAKQRNVSTIVLGLPKNMDGTEGIRAEKSRALGDMLRERTGFEIVMWDERRTTVDAHRILSDVGKHGKKRKDTVDAVAASLILEGYLGRMTAGF